MKVPIGEWIQKQRGAGEPEPRFTQRDLAHACKTDVGNVSRWERGIVVPKAEAFMCLCELFGIDPIEARKVIEFVAPNAPQPKKGHRAVEQSDDRASETEDSGTYVAVDSDAPAEPVPAAGSVS
jgi:transcriptional regulator with XRE-family HTH domain